MHTLSHLVATRYNLSLLLPADEQLQWSSWRLSALFKGKSLLLLRRGRATHVHLSYPDFPAGLGIWTGDLPAIALTR